MSATDKEYYVGTESEIIDMIGIALRHAFQSNMPDSTRFGLQVNRFPVCSRATSVLAEAGWIGFRYMWHV